MSDIAMMRTFDISTSALRVVDQITATQTYFFLDEFGKED